MKNSVQRLLALSLWFAATASAIDGVAQGTLDIPLCDPRVHPLECYTASSSIAIMNQELLSRKALAEYRLGTRTYNDVLSAVSDHARRYRQQIAPRYDSAAKSLTGNKEGPNLLKDYHAFWLGTLDSVLPSGNAPDSSYERRLQDRKTALEDKRNRLLLEK